MDIQPGQRVTWLHYKSYKSSIQYHPVAQVLSVQKRTAHIETRRIDGKVKRRFIKLNRLYPARS